MMNLAMAAVLAVSMPAPGLEPPTRDQIMAVPAELQAQLRDQVILKSRSKEQRLRLLLDFVSSDNGLTLAYDDETTRTVEETYRSGRANCLSFTLLFVALAREAGLKAYPQEYDQVLAWHRQDELVYNSSHVNAGVKVGRQRRTVDITRGGVIARHPPKAISDQQALAHFYNNRGAELMAAGATEAARKHMDAAIELDPTSPAAWNNLGVLSLRDGDPRAAERAYTTALELDEVHSAALSNIVTLHQRTGEHEQAARFMQRLQEARLADPFHQFILAVEYEKRGDYAKAVNHYRRAIRLHDREPVFHLGLARVYSLMGDARRAQRSQARAYALGNEDTPGNPRVTPGSLRR